MFEKPTHLAHLSYFQKILFFGMFSFSALLTLITGSAFLVRYTLHQPAVLAAETQAQNLYENPQSGVKIYAALPGELPSIGGELIASDARYEIVKNYLKKYDSPLIDKYKVLVNTADKYNIDFRLLTAIAQQESNLCKRIPAETFNCWGWGIHARGTLGFASYEDGIEKVSKGLREEYINKGYNTVDKIMTKYTPSSPGTWAYGVSTFINDMR